VSANVISRRPDFESSASQVSFHKLIKAAQDKEIVVSMKEGSSIVNEATKDPKFKEIWKKIEGNRSKRMEDTQLRNLLYIIAQKKTNNSE